MEKLFFSPSLPQTNKTKQTNEQTRKCSTPRGTYSRRGFCPASGRSPQTDRPRGSWGGADSVPACPPRRVVFMYIIPLAFHQPCTALAEFLDSQDRWAEAELSRKVGCGLPRQQALPTVPSRRFKSCPSLWPFSLWSLRSRQRLNIQPGSRNEDGM